MTRSVDGPADVVAANLILSSRLGGRRPPWMTSNTSPSVGNPSPAPLRAKRPTPPSTRPLPLTTSLPPSASYMSPTSAPLPPSSQPLTTSLPPSASYTSQTSAPSLSSSQPLLGPLGQLPTVTSEPNVLPSPAPSDEPSPTVAAYPRDSPRSDPSFNVLVDTQAVGQPNIAPTNGRLASSHLHPNPGVGHASLSNLSHTPSQTTGLAPPSGGATFRTDQQYVSSVFVLPSSAGPRMAPNVQHSAPAVGEALYYNTWGNSSRQFSYNLGAQKLQDHLDRLALQPQFSQTIDGQRLRLLKDACQKCDGVFLYLHQAYCRWSRDPQKVYRCIPNVPPDALEKAFAVLSKIIRGNDHVSHQTLNLFTEFPTEGSQYYQPLLGQFLTQLAANADAMTSLCVQRRRPMLANEMIFVLGCHSRVLQNLLFTALRRSLGVSDEMPAAKEMYRLFLADQEAAMQARENRSSAHMAGRSVKHWPRFEAENQALVARYQQLVEPIFMSTFGQVHPGPQDPSQSHQSPAQNNTASPNSPAVSWGMPAQQVPVSASSPAYSATAAAGFFASQAPMSIINNNSSVTATAPPPPPPPTLLPNSQSPGVSYFANQNDAFYLENQAVSMTHAQPPPPPQTILSQPTLTQPFSPQAQFRSGAVPQMASFTTALASSAHNARRASSGVLMRTSTSQGPSRRHSGIHKSTSNNNKYPSRDGPLLPPRGSMYRIPRSEYPRNSYNDPAALAIGLHEAHLRSPIRRNRDLVWGGRTLRSKERYYQSVVGFVVPPSPIGPSSKTYSFRFDFDKMTQLSRLRRPVMGKETEVPVAEYFQGSLRLRVRCCRIKDEAHVPNESDWATMDTSWPPNIFMTIGGPRGDTSRASKTQAVQARRAAHNSKDLPAELTDLVCEGTNILTVSVASIDGKADARHALAVEIIETRSHSSIVDEIHEKQVLCRDATLKDIDQKAGWSRAQDDDDIRIEPTKEYGIDMKDPFTMRIWQTPVRGAACLHVECFDLDNWLKTRECKPFKCGCRTFNLGCICPNSEPSLPDHWRCPICKADARPRSLRIDSFLTEVRWSLGEQGKLSNRIKKLLVSEDHSWRPVIEETEDEDEDKDERRVQMGVGNNSKSSEAFRAPTEVIDLLSDDD